MAQTNRNIDNMSPFITFCQHVIPLSYDESLSYYETLCALRNYIGQMVEAVNNNADAVTELQNKFNELQNYVDNYFKNLDVQEEINNKLDEMATDGTLDEIINTQIFGELNNKVDTNTQNIASNTEKIQTNTKNIQSNTEAIEKINDQKLILVIGDSWTSDTVAGRNLRSGAESWVNAFSKKFKQKFVNLSENAAGFVNVGDEGKSSTFVSQYTSYVNDENKDLIDKIIIFGGQNDIYNNKNIGDIENAINDLSTAINTNTPNAEVYLAYGNMQDVTFTTAQMQLNASVIEYASKKNWNVTNASGWILGGNTNLYANQSHQNASGNERVIAMMNTFLFGGTGLSVPVTFSNLKVNSSTYTNFTFNQNNVVYYPFTGRIVGTVYWTFLDGSKNQMVAYGNLGCTLDMNIKHGSEIDKFLPSVMYGATDGNQQCMVGRTNITHYNSDVYKLNMIAYNANPNNQALVIVCVGVDCSLIV